MGFNLELSWCLEFRLFLNEASLWECVLTDGRHEGGSMSAAWARHKVLRVTCVRVDGLVYTLVESDQVFEKLGGLESLLAKCQTLLVDDVFTFID